jgi:DNA polymerase III alpha subunit
MILSIMVLNEFNQPIFSSNELIKEIYKGNIEKISESIVDETDSDILKYLEFINNFNLLDWPIPKIQDNLYQSQEIFNKNNQKTWLMPKEYYELDIKTVLISKCNNEIEINRVNQELILFEKYNIIIVLKFLKYFVDTMRKHNILWGVGRGSSVASFCLYLLDVHKINSVKYNLDINEFFH